MRSGRKAPAPRGEFDQSRLSRIGSWIIVALVVAPVVAVMALRVYMFYYVDRITGSTPAQALWPIVGSLVLAAVAVGVWMKWVDR